MKKTMKLLAVAFIFGAISFTNASAQQKFGHINFQEVMALMSERDSALVKLQAYGKELTETQQAMEEDFNNKLKAYEEKKATWSQAIIEAKEKELTDLQQRIRQFQQTAQNDFGQRQQTYFAPIMEKAQGAIDKVAKSKGLIYVFDLSAGSVVYVDDIQSLNLLPLVKSELGIPASKTQPTQFAEQQ